jgi:hypothetical protein
MTDAIGGCSPAKVDELKELLGQASDAVKLNEFKEVI